MDKKQGRSVTKVLLNENDKLELERRANSYTAEVRDSLRAKIILLKSQDKTQEQIRNELNIRHRSVIKRKERK